MYYLYHIKQQATLIMTTIHRKNCQEIDSTAQAICFNIPYIQKVRDTPKQKFLKVWVGRYKISNGVLNPGVIESEIRVQEIRKGIDLKYIRETLGQTI